MDASDIAQSVIKMVKPLIPEIEAIVEQEALAFIGTKLPELGQARLIEVTPKVIAKLTSNRYAPFPSQRTDAEGPHSLPNATAYYVAMEMEGETFESDVVAGGVQALCMESPDFVSAVSNLQDTTGSETAYVQAVGSSVIAAVSVWAAARAQSAIAQVSQ